MAFLKRLGWYLAGLSIGIVFLVFFLQKKSGGQGIDFCYLPNCRVLKDMRSKPFLFGEMFPSAYQDTLLLQSFLKDGTIDFGQSDTRSTPCKTYYIAHPITGKDWIMQAVNCKDTLHLQMLTPTP